MCDSIYQLFEATVARQPDKRAIAQITDGELHWQTWQELHDRVQLRRSELEEQGIGFGNPVIHEPANSIDWIVGDLAAQSLGAVLTPPKSAFTGVEPLEGFLSKSLLADDPLATVVSTSGTSGETRTVMLTQRNLALNAYTLSEASGGDPDELRLSFLPFGHLYARTCDLYTWILRGSRLVLTESRATIFRDCQLVKPMVINGVPYFFQKTIDLADANGVSLNEQMGGKIERCYSGGAPLSKTVIEAFAKQDIPLYSGYGLTEASPVVTANTPDNYKIGSVGKPLPGVEVRIAEDSEVLVRGPNVMLGYWQNEEATAATIRDGWLHTGDLGRVDDEGFLFITGRKKDLIILATGKNVAPSRVEALLNASPWIEQVAVVGEGQKGLGAIIVPNPARLQAEIRRRKLWVWSKKRAVTHPKIREVFQYEIGAALADAAHEEQIHHFTVISRAFSTTKGEITFKLSLCRAAIERSFSREIRAMFGN